MDKPFKTYDELLDFLENEKELAIPDREAAKQILAKISYYSLITGYKKRLANVDLHLKLTQGRVRTFSWTKQLIQDYVYTKLDSWPQKIFSSFGTK